MKGGGRRGEGCRGERGGGRNGDKSLKSIGFEERRTWPAISGT